MPATKGTALFVQLPPRPPFILKKKSFWSFPPVFDISYCELLGPNVIQRERARPSKWLHVNSTETQLDVSSSFEDQAKFILKTTHQWQDKLLSNGTGLLTPRVTLKLMMVVNILYDSCNCFDFLPQPLPNISDDSQSPSLLKESSCLTFCHHWKLLNAANL